ncbi:hypothetical protein XNC1_3409 [Xenorhabdus nematophila ATCC 19061]|uniref:Uncharacterized protein n=1 Tax=Xenorhabdus nematophila (strain ATCC 19061 / DSM 3370 / CCUG 14189 / LMG 1036 / NCIMB 9965 / AN6) TaxID=406817 RepID=D3V9A6_XENNA|nr:hypothetical protein XNC1_3409 [Xenorhabdus nematophila ATCC 19061]
MILFSSIIYHTPYNTPTLFCLCLPDFYLVGTVESRVFIAKISLIKPILSKMK